MSVNSEYKQTPLGKLPIDWEVGTIGTVSNVVRGGSPRPAGDPKYFKGNYIPWLTVASLTNLPESETVVTKTDDFLTEEGSKYSRTLEVGTVIIANSGATLGVAKLLGIRCCANDGIAALLNTKSVDRLFLCHFINSRTKNLREVVATGNGQPNLNTGLIGNIGLPIPPLVEQGAISTALGDVDQLITALDHLISKKRAIKQATMQQLLTGKQRLAGFSSEGKFKKTEIGLIPNDWECVELRHVLESFKNGYAFSAKGYSNSGMPIVTMAQIGLDGTFQYDETRVNRWPLDDASKLEDFYLHRGDLVISMTDVTPQKNLIGRVAEVNIDGPLLLNQRVGLLKLNRNKMNPYFLRSYANSSPWRIYCRGVSTLGVQANLGTSEIGSGKIPLPSLYEQSLIAEVLSGMDLEILTIEKRLDKTKLIKLGMIQELLTGKTRLV